MDRHPRLLVGVLLGALATLVVLLLLGQALNSRLEAIIRSAGQPATGSPGPTPIGRVLTPVELWAAIDEDRPVETMLGRVRLVSREIARLNLPSGRVVTSDPFFAVDAVALSRTVAAGRHPVVVHIARFPDGDERVAAAVLVLGRDRPVRWELALTPGQGDVSLAPDEFLVYGVDSGTGAFTSPEAAARLATRPPPDLADDPLLKALRSTEVRSWSWADLVLDPTGGLNLVAFSSGWGDGSYPSSWGLDEAGQPVVLVTDFGVLYVPLERGPGTPAVPSPSN